MNEPILGALFEFLLWWSLVTVGYAVAIFTLDSIICAWQRRRAALLAEKLRLEQIDTEMRSSVGRLAIEFLAAQQEMRRVGQREVDRH